MKQSKKIDDIIVAFLSGTAEERDLKLLKEWSEVSYENEAQLAYLKKIWEERSSEPKFVHYEELAEKIWQEGMEDGRRDKYFIPQKRYGVRSISYFLKIAVVVILFVLTPYLIFHFRKSIEKGNKITESVSITQKQNPAGQKTRINLPDGSVVWLNSLSSISYPVYFSDSARTIALEGEAYFEVKKDSLRPFTVKSGNISTTALGTSFNINAYPDQDDIHIGLITGKVWIRDSESEKSLILNHNHGVVYNKKDKLIKEVAIDPQKILAWKNGILLFDGENFREFVSKLEKWYGVEIIVEGDPPNGWEIRGNFADEYLSNILASISFNKKFSYSINRKEVVLKFK